VISSRVVDDTGTAMPIRLFAFALALLLAACKSSGPTKEEQDAAKNTVDCDHGGDRVVIRFEDGEARMLMPDATRVILYQLPSASGVRYTNGMFELRGRGLDLQLTRDGVTVRMICTAYEIPVKAE